MQGGDYRHTGSGPALDKRKITQKEFSTGGGGTGGLVLFFKEDGL